MSDSLRPLGRYSPWHSPSQSTGVGNHSLLQGIFPSPGLNPGLLQCRRILYQLSHQGSPFFFKKMMHQLVLDPYLFIHGSAGFLWLWRVRAAPRCGVRASCCSGFLCCRAHALGTQASVVAHGLSCSTAGRLFLDQGPNSSPLRWQVSLTHCTTSEVP